MELKAQLVSVTDETFEREVLESNQPVLVDFWAEWCAPCRALGPIVERLAGEYAGKVKVAKVDIDANTQTARALGIRSIPTVMVFENGDIKEQFVGVRAIDDYRSSLNKTIN